MFSTSKKLYHGNESGYAEMSNEKFFVLVLGHYQPNYTHTFPVMWLYLYRVLQYLHDAGRLGDGQLAALQGMRTSTTPGIRHRSEDGRRGGKRRLKKPDMKLCAH